LIVQIEKKLFDSLPVNSTGHTCFEPMVPVYQEGLRQRNGQEANEYRVEFLKFLSQGQRTLWGFFTYYDHAIQSKDEVQRISKHYLSQQIFGIVKRSVEYFNDNDMGQLFLRIEQTISANGQDDTMSADIDELYKQLCEIAPHTLPEDILKKLNEMFGNADCVSGD